MIISIYHKLPFVGIVVAIAVEVGSGVVAVLFVIPSKGKIN